MTAPMGEIWRVAGPVVVARGLDGVRLYNVVHVGDAELPGEVIRLDGERATIQVYEDTAGLRVGEPVRDTGRPLEVELGPGLLGRIFDGTQRPLEVLARVGDDPVGRPLLPRGVDVPALDRERAWTFEPRVETGASVAPGDVLGVVAETTALEHRVLVPMDRTGIVTAIHPGPARLEDPVAWIDDEPVTMLSRWPVRDPRPFEERLDPSMPLITGQRAIDVLFPIARGGAATIPGGFGTGKTVLQQSLAKWAHADVVVYIGCGERGNELTEVLQEFPALVDPRTGASLMERTVLVANTSNMPVAAREASIYTGITLAEYFRDQGYHVALMADSTSRWGEALREVSSRLEEMPAEEGYPAYLSTRLAEFYERAAAVRCLGNDRREGSVTHHRCRLAGRRRLLRADHPALAAAGGHVLGAGHPAGPRSATSRRSTGTAATPSTTSPAGSGGRSPPNGRTSRLGARAAPAGGAAARDRPAPRHRHAGAARARRAQDRAPAARGLPPAVGVRRARRLLRSAQAARDAAGDPPGRRGDAVGRRPRSPERAGGRRAVAGRTRPDDRVAAGTGERERGQR